MIYLFYPWMLPAMSFALFTAIVLPAPVKPRTQARLVWSNPDVRRTARRAQLSLV